MTWALHHAGAPVELPFVTTYRRDDNGETRYVQVQSFTPPAPSALTQARDRGSLLARYGATADGPWGPPYYGADPASYGFEIKEEKT